MLQEKTIDSVKELLEVIGYNALAEELTNDNFEESFHFAIKMEGREKYKLLLAKGLEAGLKEM